MVSKRFLFDQCNAARISTIFETTGVNQSAGTYSHAKILTAWIFQPFQAPSKIFLARCLYSVQLKWHNFGP